MPCGRSAANTQNGINRIFLPYIQHVRKYTIIIVSAAVAGGSGDDANKYMPGTYGFVIYERVEGRYTAD
jgi:hypothetical protein